jgi:hypothetical protein
MSSTLIIRIGPIFDEDSHRMFFYMPLSPEIAHDQVVFEADDEVGLAAVAGKLTPGSFACAPALADAARKLDIPVRAPSRTEARLACDVALGLNPPDGVPAVSDRVMRRSFFASLAAAMKAPVWQQLEAGALAQGSAEGGTSSAPVRVELTVAMRREEGEMPIFMVAIAGSGTDDAGDVDVVLATGPEYLSDEMQRAYGMAVVPRLFLQSGAAPQDWNDRWLPVLTAALWALAELGGHPSVQPAEDTSLPGGSIRCDMHLLG